MKKEIKETKVFKVARFETLNSDGNVLLKGGFSPVYEEKAAFGGKSTPVVVANVVAGCDGTITINSVKGCGGPSGPITV
ncbi:hypothetical protein FACS189451_08140 [Bacteroidia bacterium]|nr:hypothetical protein FACS189446_5090 [Bacteroidia bacterium]GHT62829.1 hypothetical protein FACS189451_08140 [Bacteroidia bacterium]